MKNAAIAILAVLLVAIAARSQGTTPVIIGPAQDRNSCRPDVGLMDLTAAQPAP